MADWEQRLRLYAASNSRRSTSPAFASATQGDAVPAVSQQLLNAQETRAKSPNALERLRASTAMNLVALELRRSEAGGGRSDSVASSLATRRTGNSPTRAAGLGSAGGSTTVLPSALMGWSAHSESVESAVPKSRTGSAPVAHPAVSSQSNYMTTSFTPFHGGNVSMAPSSSSIPRSASPVSATRQYTSTDYLSPKPQPSSVARAATPQRAPSSPPSSSSVGLSGLSPAVMADSFQPQTILQMLETKMRSLEARNLQLESTVQTLTSHNQELTQALSAAESKVHDHQHLQAVAQSLQREVERLREEVLAVSQREERRLEELRRRFTAELDEERRQAALSQQELMTLRSGIRHLANIEHH